MTALIWDTHQVGDRRAQATQMIAPSAVFLALAMARLAIQYLTAGALHLEDDAYYYTVIAHNIAQSGVSTFDGQTLTNGYHPLWVLLLVLQDLTVGPSLYATIAIELCLATVGVALLATSFLTRSLLFHVAFGVAMAVATRPFIAKGMEVSLLLFATGVFTRTIVAYRNGAASASAAGLAAVLCIGARIDSAVFVAPVLLLASSGVRKAIVAFVPVAIAGAVYGGVNLAVFGIAFPVSGAVKSIGGLQINWRLLEQFVRESSRDGHLSIGAFANGMIGRCLICLVLCSAGFFATRRGSKGRLFVSGYILGMAIFSAKLVFGSSWVIWAWYTFPAVLGIVALFHVLDDVLADNQWTAPLSVAALLAAALVAGAGWQVRAGASRIEPSFEAINQKAAREFGPILQGERVAMGDRAGSFASFYSGPVTQLEGLVNDNAYYRALKNHDDIRPLLCARGVRFVLSYQQDLGAYQSVAVPVIRPRLTSFQGPALTFTRADEIGRVFDLEKFDNRGLNDEGDNYLYAWRLTGCGETQ